ncbi:MFS transporter, partial [Singulisphaera rosea]
CADIGERAAGTLGGAMNMMANVGGAVAAMVTGSLFKHDQANLVFLICSAVYLIGSLSWLNVDATKSLTTGEARPSAAH